MKRHMIERESRLQETIQEGKGSTLQNEMCEYWCQATSCK